MTLKPLPYFRTERLHLRMAEDQDVPGIVLHFDENRDFFMPTDPVRPPGFYTEKFWYEQIRRSTLEFHQDQSVRLFLFTQDNVRVIGTVNLTQIVRGPLQGCYLGYGISNKYQGQGLMTEALRAAIHYAFEELRLHRVMANYMPHNLRSARVLERLGFKIEGQAKDYLMINGQWQDHVLTSLIHPGWSS
jgi:ribosomal-protein-alanine N-acetyltransferase